MLRATFYSGALHALIVILAIFGLPKPQKEMRDFPEIPITVLTVAELTALSRPKPESPKIESPKPETTPQEPSIAEPPRPIPAPPEIEPAKPEPAKTAPAKPEPAKTESAKPPPPEPKPVKPEPAKTPPAKTEPLAPVLRPATRPPPDPRPPEPKPAEKAVDPPVPSEAKTVADPSSKPAKPDFLTSVLKTLEERQQQSPPEPRESEKKPDKDPPRAAHTPTTQPMTISELDVVRRQFIACWNVPIGSRSADDLSVQIRVHVNSDGTVYESYLLDPQRARTDSFYRAAAESALRAVRNPRCNPLRLPAGKYDRWKVMTLNFDPKEMF